MAAQDTWELAQSVAWAVAWAEGTSGDLVASDGLRVSFPARVPRRSTPAHRAARTAPSRLPCSVAWSPDRRSGPRGQVETDSLLSRFLRGKEHFVPLPLPPSTSG